MKSLIAFPALVICVALAGSVNAQLIVKDDFESSNIQDWKQGTTFFNSNGFITGGGLTYNNHPGSGEGNYVMSFSAGSGSLARYATLDLTSNPEVYALFMINVGFITGSDLLVMNFVGSPEDPINSHGLVMRQDGGNVQFGLRVGGVTTYDAGSHATNMTHLIVVRYTDGSGTFSLAIDPALTTSEPTYNVTAGPFAMAPSYISMIEFHDTSGANYQIDGIRVASSWNHIMTSGGGLLLSESFESIGNITSNEWTFLSGDMGAISVSSSGLTYDGIGSVADGKANIFSFGTESSFTKTLSTPVSSGTVYMSFITKRSGSSANEIMANINFYNAGQSAWSTQQGFVVDGTQAGIKYGPNQSDVSNVTTMPTAEALFVLGYNVGTGMYSLYKNPSVGGSSPDGFVGSATGTFAGTVVGVTLMQPGASFNFEIDEIRVSTDWAEVVSVSGASLSQPEALFLNPFSTSVSGNYNTSGAGLEYLVIKREGLPSTTFVPVDGTNYSENLFYDDARVVETQNAGNFNDNYQIAAADIQFYKIFSNDGELPPSYNIDGPLQGIVVATYNSASMNLSITGRTESSITLSMNSFTSNASQFVIVRTISGSHFFTDGRPYYVGDTDGNATVVYRGSGSTFTDSGLSPGQTYNYYTAAIVGTGSFTDLLTTGAQVSGTTLLAEPSAQPTALSITDPQPNFFTVNFTQATGGVSGYLVIRRDLTSPTSVPVDGVAYSNGHNFGNGDVVVYYGPDFSNITASSLNFQTQYFLDVYSYSEIVGFPNYRHTSPPLEGSGYTLANSPGSPPHTLSFSAVSTTTLNVNWNSDGANTLIIRRTGLSPTNSTPVNGTTYTVGDPLNSGTVVHYGAGTTLPDASLIAGTQYFYDFYKFQGTGPTSNYYVTALEGSVFTLPSAPTTTAATAVQQTSFTANWNSVVSATGYRIDVVTAPGFPGGTPVITNQFVAGTSLNVLALTAGTTYYYRVRAENSSGTSADSNVTSQITAPANPVAIEETLPTNQTSFMANWNSVPTATEYRVDVSLSNVFAGFVYQDVDVDNNLFYNVPALTAGTTYYYRVRALNGSLLSGNSNTITVVTVPPNPVAAAALSVNQTTFTANWNPSTTADNYRIDVASTSDFSSGNVYTNTPTGNVTTFAATVPTAGITYYYRVRATSLASGNGFSGNSTPLIAVLTLPPTPNISAATAITTSTFAANWMAGTGGSPSNYRLDVATDPAFTAILGGYNNLNVGNVLTFPVAGLFPGTQYYYRVRSENTTGLSPVSSSSNPITIPLAPTVNAGSGSTTTSFNANWNTVTGAPGAANYRLDVDDDPAFGSMLLNDITPSTTTSHTVSSGLTAGTTYYWRVRARNSAGGTSGNSVNGSHMTLTTAPVGSAASAVTANSFSANWTTTTGAAGYRLDVATDAGFTSILGGYNNLDVGNVLTYGVTGLNPGTTYHYRLRAVNIGGTSASTASPISVTTVPPVPVPAAATQINTTSFRANWTASATANNYRIDVANDPAFTSILGSYNNLLTGNVILLDVTGLTSGNTYYYRLRAVSAAGTSTSSSTISVSTVPPNPTVGAADQVGQTSFRANWSTSNGATSYKLDVATSPSFTGAYVTGYQDLTVSPPFTVSTNLAAGTTYYYRVRAVNSGGTSGNSANASLTTVPPNPVASAATSVGTTTFAANWAASTSATAYFLDVATDNAFSSLVSGYNNLSVGNVVTYNVNTNLTAGTNYYYRVRANSASGTSFSSNTINLITVTSAPTANAADNVAQASFRANWTATTGAASYRIDVSTSNTFSSYVTGYNDASAGTGTSFTVNTNLSAGTTYYYRLRAVNVSGTSVNSNQITTLTIPPDPASPTVSATAQTSFTANWSASTSATSYLIDVSADGFNTFVGAYSALNVGDVTSVSVTGLSAGTNYAFRVKAVNGSGQSGFSAIQTVLTISPDPVSTSATGTTETTFTANWNASTAATGYRLDVASDVGFSSYVSGYQDLTVAGTSSSVTGLTANTTYYYRVRAINGSGTSGNSNSVTQLTVSSAPVATSASGITTNGFTANWNASAGATSYRLDVSEDNAFSSFVTSFNDAGTAVTTLAVTGLNPGTTYYYRVRSVNASGTSVSGNTISQITVSSAPVAVDPTLITISSFVANWNAVQGAADYRLDVSLDNFSSFISGFNNVTISGLSTSVTGLSEGVTYQYRVRASNAGGISSNSNSVSVVTVPPVPDATAATNVTTTGFTANWEAVSGATSYSLDISTDDFASYLSGYNNKVLSTTSEAVTGLNQNTIYKYRVRATSSSGTSANSAVTTVLTFPVAPVATAATGPTQSGFTANWQSVPGITSYRFDLSSDDFATLVAGFNDLTVSATTLAVTGLGAGVNYKYRVRAVNATGPSANSSNISMPTIPATPVSNAATSVTTTGFTLNWTAVTGATGYSIDVSVDNFTTFITGYNGKTVVTSPEIVVGLTQNTAYKYRVRSLNTSGSSGNSADISVLTVPDAPVVSAATVHTQTTFTANWQSVAGITNYRLDVSADDFATRIAGFDDLSVSGTTKVVTGLTPGTNYKYRVRAINATSPSSNSSSTSVLTLPATPSFATTTAVTASGFSINWTTIASADSYLLDVATTSTFASNSMLAGYTAKVVTATSEGMTGLASGTLYYFRVKAKNATGESGFSPTGTQITIPATPVANAGQNINNNGFTASWSPVQGAEYYEIDVTLVSSNFSTFVTGYNARVVPDAEVEEAVIGLAPATDYYFRVRAVNAGGKSGNSGRKAVRTSGSTAVFSVAVNSTSNVQFSGSPVNVSGTVANGAGTTSVTLFHKGITASSFQTKVLTPNSSGAYTVVIEDNMLDEIGVEFYVEAKDETDKVVKSETQRIYRTVAPTTTILSGNLAGTRASIKIIAIPYQLQDDDIENIFVSLGQYDKKTWRMAHYQDGANVEYQDGLLKVERGLGYWFNAKGNLDIKPGTGSVPPNHNDAPFSLTLDAGWNQIGNPYPFAIDWSDVLADNPSVQGVGELFIYNGAVGNFDEGDTMEPFTGGFVRSTGPVTLNVKVSLKATGGGRKRSAWNYDIGKDSWMLPLSLKDNQSTYNLGAIGMDPQSLTGHDNLDELRLPRFGDYLDITFDHPGEKFRSFTRDITATASKAVWKFTAETSAVNETGTLTWDNTRFGSSVAQIFLLDVESLQMIDMRLIDSYQFVNPGKKEFRIYYSRNGDPVAPDLIGMGQPYPNPSEGDVSVIVALPNTHQEFSTELVAYDMMGREVKSVGYRLQPGIHELTWDGTGTEGGRVRGVHILRTRVNKDMLPNSFRIVMK